MHFSIFLADFGIFLPLSSSRGRGGVWMRPSTTMKVNFEAG